MNSKLKDDKRLKELITTVSMSSYSNKLLINSEEHFIKATKKSRK